MLIHYIYIYMYINNMFSDVYIYIYIYIHMAGRTSAPCAPHPPEVGSKGPEAWGDPTKQFFKNMGFS